MSFVETIRRARALLETEERVSLRILRREFELDNDALDDLVNELVDVQRVAKRSEDVLHWTGNQPQDPSRTDISPGHDTTKHDAERRQLTVLFTDLVDSTQLAAELDAEDWREIMRRYQGAVTRLVEEFGGYVAQYLGDGVLAYFGFPSAHEDDAERGVRAGLATVNAISELNESIVDQFGCELGVRVGIHTGSVVVGEMGDGESRETLATGETTNLAARLQSVAEPNTVVMGEPTSRLVSGIFVTHDLGDQTLKGLARPVRAFRVDRSSGVRSRLDIVAAGELTPFVGREQELMLLQDRFAQVTEGSGQAISVCGEAGIGKSRLVREFRKQLTHCAHTWLECQGSHYTRDSAFYPVLDLHRQALGFRSEDPPAAKLIRIEEGLSRAKFELETAVPIVAALHGVPLDERYAPPNLSPEGMRKKTLALLTEWLLRLGQHQPLVLLLEDLHWMDPSSLELVGRILEQLPTVDLLLVATYRPDFELNWGTHSYVTPMLLSRIPRRQLIDIVQNSARGHELPDEWVTEILRRSDGVPLFAEELTRTVVEMNPEPHATGSAPALHIPETLKDSLMARLDSLGHVRELAQLGAVLGREFSYELLLATSPLSEDELLRALGKVVHEELFYQRGTPPESIYLFRHALIREAAYESMLRPTRQRYHGRVAAAILERMSDIAESNPELVAHHFTEANEADSAIGWWTRSGERANARADYAEGISSLKKGLSLLPSISRDRETSEFNLQLLLGMAFAASRGFAAPETMHSWERAHSLSDNARDPRQIGLIHRFVGIGHMSAGKFRDALAHYEKVLSLGNESHDTSLQTAGNLGCGMVQLYLGWHDESRQSFEAAIELSDDDPDHLFQIGPLRFPSMYARAWHAWGQWLRGYPDKSKESAHETIQLARKKGEPYSISYMTTWAAITALQRRDWHEARELGIDSMRIADEQGYAFNAALSRMAEGAGAFMGDVDEAGLKRLTDALMAAGATGNVAGITVMLTIFAQVLLTAGLVEEAKAQVDRGIDVASSIEEGFFLAELYRLKGEIAQRRQNSNEAEIEASFQRAIEIARDQKARSLELRAAISLARFWVERGKRPAALELLQPLVAWFTEGFDTQDLQDAKSLLAKLHAKSAQT